MTADLDEILDAESCEECGGYGCEECEGYELCEMCGGENGEHETGCPNDDSPYARLCRDGYD